MSDSEQTTPGPAAGPAPSPDLSPPVGPRDGRNRRWLVVSIVAVVVLIGVVVAAVVLVEDQTLLRAGSGTATVTWTGVGQLDPSADTLHFPAQPFTLDIAGHTGSGTSTVDIPTGSAARSADPVGSSFPIFRYRGTVDSKAFDLAVTVHYGTVPASSSAPTTTTVSVAGTFDGMAVRATVTQPDQAADASGPVSFAGTIGHWHVTGTFTQPSGPGAHRTVTAHYAVSA